MSRRRVVITGLGPVTAHGVGIEPLWSALCEGRSALAPMRGFDARGFRAASGGELPATFDVKEFVPKSYRKATKVMARDIEIAVGGAAPCHASHRGKHSVSTLAHYKTADGSSALSRRTTVEDLFVHIVCGACGCVA